MNHSDPRTTPSSVSTHSGRNRPGPQVEAELGVESAERPNTPSGGNLLPPKPESRIPNDGHPLFRVPVSPPGPPPAFLCAGGESPRSSARQVRAVDQVAFEEC